MKYFLQTWDTHESTERFQLFRSRNAKTGIGFYAVELIATGQFLGFTGLNQPTFESDFTPCIEIGWRLRPEFWGQGFATEAATAVLEHGWSTWNVTEIVAIAPAVNLPSISVMKKIGMQLVKPFRHPLLEGSPGLVECLLYSIDRPQG